MAFFVGGVLFTGTTMWLGPRGSGTFFFVFGFAFLFALAWIVGLGALGGSLGAYLATEAAFGTRSGHPR